jgi:hypothetical protein
MGFYLLNVTTEELDKILRSALKKITFKFGDGKVRFVSLKDV